MTPKREAKTITYACQHRIGYLSNKREEFKPEENFKPCKGKLVFVLNEDTMKWSLSPKSENVHTCPFQIPNVTVRRYKER